MNLQEKRSWREISLPNLEHNYRALRAMLPRDCRFLGVVKANAYGHGALTVARTLEKLGAEYLAVACLDEGRELRDGGIQMPILILGSTPTAYAEELLRLDLTQTVCDLPSARAFSAAAQGAGKTLKIHIKVDTGMSRLGFLCDEAHRMASAEEIAAVCALPGLDHEGIFTHFSDADGSEAYTMLQFTRFLDILKNLETLGLTFAIRHCAASAAMLNYPCTHLDMVRPGLALYGHYPDPSCQGLDGPGLLPVMELKSRIAALRDLPAGTSVSYGRTCTLTRDSRLAALPIGYADGLPRACSNRLQVLIRGQRCPILGRVCMDMCMVDVTDLPQVQVGEIATVYGRDGAEFVPTEEAAQIAGTVQYELLCAISERVPRVYLD
ncbi:MAG: alanine racemase [Pseudoflavonifractor sp.]